MIKDTNGLDTYARRVKGIFNDMARSENVFASTHGRNAEILADLCVEIVENQLRLEEEIRRLKNPKP